MYANSGSQVSFTGMVWQPVVRSMRMRMDRHFMAPTVSGACAMYAGLDTDTDNIVVGRCWCATDYIQPTSDFENPRIYRHLG